MQHKKAPWTHPSELAMVRDWFYPQHAPFDPYAEPPADMRQQAIDWVALWTSKIPHLLTHAVLATASLTEAILHDERPGRERFISDGALQSIYAMAFCRFVTGLVDRDVAKANTAAIALTAAEASRSTISGGGRGEISMFAHATKIKLPIAFVELRHQATHGKMPELEYLRVMTRQGLEWLYERWWRRNATGNAERALRRRELERVEAEETRLREGVKGGREEIDRVGRSLENLQEVDEDGDELGVAVSGVADEMLCRGCRKRKRGLDEDNENDETGHQ